jgi:serine kinase of HPr protein (carbohydrate metabolism regulator)
MTTADINIHATAIMVGGRGLLFVGPSGSGKSALAFACLVQAQRHGAEAGLIADDRVLVSDSKEGLVARCAAPIAGLIELRGCGIVRVDSLESARLDLAIEVISLPEADRLPPEDDRYVIGHLGWLPLVRLWNKAPDPLAYLAALHAPLRTVWPFDPRAPQILT